MMPVQLTGGGPAQFLSHVGWMVNFPSVGGNAQREVKNLSGHCIFLGAISLNLQTVSDQGIGECNSESVRGQCIGQCNSNYIFGVRIIDFGMPKNQPPVFFYICCCFLSLIAQTLKLLEAALVAYKLTERLKFIPVVFPFQMERLTERAEIHPCSFSLFGWKDIITKRNISTMSRSSGLISGCPQLAKLTTS